MPSSLRLVVVAVSFAANAAVLATLGRMAPEPHATRYILIAAFLMALFNGLVPFRLNEAVLQSILSLAAYTAALIVTPAPPMEAMAGHIGMAIFIVVGSLAQPYRQAIDERRLFVLKLRDELRARELEEANRRLTYLSLRDPLTGVGNRRSFDMALQSSLQMAADSEKPIALLMVDVDYFKAYNDCYGHAEGDQCLRAVARALQGSLRGGDKDFIARFGGEEFVSILPDAALDVAQAVAERMRQAVEQLRLPHARQAGGAWVTVSVGVAVATLTTAHLAAADLVQSADAELYRAKQAGRNRVVATNCAGSVADQTPNGRFLRSQAPAGVA
jgi:diguanylate cyclase (GGDEF)-like protein